MPSSFAFCCDAKAAASAAWRERMGRDLVAEAMLCVMLSWACRNGRQVCEE